MKVLFGIIGLIILVLLVRNLTGTSNNYQRNRERIKSHTISDYSQIIEEEDLEKLPLLISNYLRYVGVVGKERVTFFEADIAGQMKLDRSKDWAPIKAHQTSSIDQKTRLFYMTMAYNGIPINGLHHFESGSASMVVKILDLIKVADNTGLEMDQSETVTYFNDLCVFAPGALLDADVVWEEIDEFSIKGTFTNEGVSVSADLYFDEEGKLINFISNDRYSINEDGSLSLIPWSTPIECYEDFHGYRLVAKGQAIYHYPEGDFAYIEMRINDVVY